MEKFTQGDWRVWGDWAIKCDGVIVAQFENGNFANGRLISAAPEMYRMLESVLSEMHGLIDEVNDQRASRITSQTETEPDYHDMETLHNIQLLLKKARGE